MLRVRDPVWPAGLKPGELVGHYEIVECVGVGGAACVYKARRGEGFYALKVLTDCYLDEAVASDEQQEAHARASREFVAVKAVNHPNILRAYGYDCFPEATRGWPYIVTEFVDGPNIYRWRKEAQPSLRRLCTVLEKVADALGHVHRAGLVHRDVKAENILIRRESEEPVLIDLGIARHGALRSVTERRELPLVLGTRTHYPPEYVAHIETPARAFGAPFQWTPGVDLYAFGFVAYELLTGRPPVIASENEDELWHAIKNDPVADARSVNPAIPEELSRLVMRLLEKDPAARPESADEVRVAVEGALRAGGPEFEGPFPVPPAAPAGVRKRVDERALQLRALVAAGVAKATGQDPGLESEEQWSDGEGGAEGGEEFEPPAVKLEEDAVDGGKQSQPRAEGDPAERTGESASARRAGQKRLGAARPWQELSPRHLLLAGGVVSCALIALIASRGGEKAAGKDDLLARFEREQRAGSRDGGPGAAALAATRLAVPDAPRPSRSEAKDIDAAIAARYGRPTVPPGGVAEDEGSPGGGDGIPPEMATAAGGRGEPKRPEKGKGQVVAAGFADPFMHAIPVGDALDAPRSPDAGPRKFGIPMGAHIRAKLVSNLDSRTISSGPVEAILPYPFMLHGEVLLPARTMLYGRASDGGGRFNVQFTQMRLPDDMEVAFDGLAFDRSDNKPGLAASARIAPSGGSGDDGLGTKIARGTGNVLLNSVTGGVAQDVGRGAGSAVVNNRSSDLAGGGGNSAILLDSGVLFDVFVGHSF